MNNELLLNNEFELITSDINEEELESYNASSNAVRQRTTGKKDINLNTWSTDFTSIPPQNWNGQSAMKVSIPNNEK
jgi:hypothetical protein